MQIASPTRDLPGNLSRAGRRRRMPPRLCDYLPTTTVGIPSHIPLPLTVDDKSYTVNNTIDHIQSELHAEPSDDLDLNTLQTPVYYQTPPNDFGVYRCYQTHPVSEPQEGTSLQDLSDSPTLQNTSAASDGTQAMQGFGPRVVSTLRDGLKAAGNWFYPFLNETVFRLMAWANTGSNLKSNEEVQRLVDDIILAPGFKRKHLKGFRVTKELARLDNLDKPGNVFSSSDGWNETSVKIPVPKEGTRFPSEADAPTFEVPDVFFRKLTEVIRSAAEASDAYRFNWLPFRQYWRRCKQNSPSSAHHLPAGHTEDDSDGPYEHIRLFSDIPDTDAMIEEEARIRSQPRHPDDQPDVEYAIAPLLLWSDSTHLANFGGAHLWPVYLYFGWLSKCVRSCPTKFAAHHLAYIPLVCSRFHLRTTNIIPDVF